MGCGPARIVVSIVRPLPRPAAVSLPPAVGTSRDPALRPLREVCPERRAVTLAGARRAATTAGPCTPVHAIAFNLSP